MMVLVASGAAGVTMATDDYAAPSASEQTLSDLVQQVKSWNCSEAVQQEMVLRIQQMNELSKENVDVLAETGAISSVQDEARKKIKELCMNILASNQLGQLLRDCVNGSDQTLARKKVEMLFKYCDVDITQANLVELAPAMKEFQDSVRTEDPAAKAVDHCYYGHHNQYDLRDYYSVWQKKSVGELKSELKILQDIVEDHTVYPWVKWFYKKVKTDLINEIILKEPSFYDDPMMGLEKYSISTKAQKAVDAWKKKTEADEKTAKESAKEAEGHRRKTMAMGALVNEYEKKYRQNEYGDVEAEFKEREMSERESLQQAYSEKSFDDLVKFLKTLSSEKKKYEKSSDPYGLYRLRNHWIKIQRDEAETALLQKLTQAKPDDYQTLYDDHYDDNLGFSNKLYSAFEKRKSQIKAHLVKMYQKMTSGELLKLEKKLGKEKYSTNLMEIKINQVKLDALKKSKKTQSQGDGPVHSVKPDVMGSRPYDYANHAVAWTNEEQDQSDRNWSDDDDQEPMKPIKPAANKTMKPSKPSANKRRGLRKSSAKKSAPPRQIRHWSNDDDDDILAWTNEEQDQSDRNWSDDDDQEPMKPINLRGKKGSTNKANTSKSSAKKGAVSRGRSNSAIKSPPKKSAAKTTARRRSKSPVKSRVNKGVSAE